MLSKLSFIVGLKADIDYVLLTFNFSAQASPWLCINFCIWDLPFFAFIFLFFQNGISFIIIFFYFIFKLYKIVLVLPNITMNPPQVYMCSPSWTLLPPPSPYHPSGSSQCTSPKHPILCIEPGLATHFIHDILHVLMPFSQDTVYGLKLESKSEVWNYNF